MIPKFVHRRLSVLKRYSAAPLLGLLAFGCNHTPPNAGEPSPTPASPSASATAKALPNVPVDRPDLDQTSNLHFNSNLQWYTPKNWLGQGPWTTPEGILLKEELFSKSDKLTSGEKASEVFRDACGMQQVNFTQKPTLQKQSDFHIWTCAGKAHKRNAKHVVEPVVWWAALVERQHPVGRSPQRIFIAIGPPKASQQCQQALQTLVQSIDVSGNGATPPRLKVEFTRP